MFLKAFLYTTLAITLLWSSYSWYHKIDTTGVNIGTEVYITSPQEGVITLAPSGIAYLEVSEKIQGKTFEQVTKILYENEFFGVSAGSKGIITYIDERNSMVRVRITEGLKEIDKDKVGLEGFIPLKLISRTKKYKEVFIAPQEWLEHRI